MTTLPLLARVLELLRRAAEIEGRTAPDTGAALVRSGAVSDQGGDSGDGGGDEARPEERRAMKEEWRVISDSPLYSVSNQGRVRRDAGGRGAIVGRILKPSMSTVGYLMVHIPRNGKVLMRLVHRLVAVAFIDNPQGKNEVNHKSGIKTDNAVSNLEWTTTLENHRHASRIGLKASGERHNSVVRPESIPRGTRHGMVKITEQDVRSIRNFAAYGFYKKDIGAKFGIGETHTCCIVNRKNWSHVK